jgi:transcriptional regulator with XRE-family HTH domain
MLNGKISDRLRQARKSKDLQQKTMAEKLQISRAGYSRMETGKVEITTKNLIKIAEILDISLDWLILAKVDQTKHKFEFSGFGKYAGAIEAMFTELKEDELMMHGVLSFFFELKGKNQKRRVAEKSEMMYND